MKDEPSFNQPVQQPAPEPSTPPEPVQPLASPESAQALQTSPDPAPTVQPSPALDVEPATGDTSTPQQTAYSQPVAAQEEPVTPLQPSAPASTVLGASATPDTLAVTPTGGGSGKKKLILASILAGALVLLGGGGAAAYNLWYQNPEKVLSDALINAAKAKTVTYTGAVDIVNLDKTSSSYTSKLETIKLSFDGKSAAPTGELSAKLTVKYDGKNYDLTGSGLVDKDANLYVKVGKVKELIIQLVEGSGMTYEQLPSYIHDTVAKLDSKWVRIEAKDIKEYSGSDKDVVKCVQDAFKKLDNDKAMSKEIAKLYQDNKFVIIKEKLPSKNNSLGYVLDIDNAKLEAFGKAGENSAFAKEVKKCGNQTGDSSGDSSYKAETDGTTSRVEVWVGRWNHHLTKVYATSESKDVKGSMTFEPKFNQAVNIVAPTDFVKAADLQKIYEDAMKQYEQEMYQSTSFGSTGSVSESSFEL